MPKSPFLPSHRDTHPCEGAHRSHDAEHGRLSQTWLRIRQNTRVLASYGASGTAASAATGIRCPSPTLGSAGRSEDVAQFTQESRLALGADDLLDRLAALEQHHGGQGQDLVVACGARVGVHVELGDGQLVGVRARDLLEYRG